MLVADQVNGGQRCKAQGKRLEKCIGRNWARVALPKMWKRLGDKFVRKEKKTISSQTFVFMNDGDEHARSDLSLTLIKWYFR